MVLGLTGQYCAGKDTVAEILKKRGFIVIDEDALGHEALEKQVDQICAVFGTDILDDNNRIDRKKLGGLVFQNSELLIKLERIVHPWMVDRTEQLLKAGSKSDAVINAAILVKMNLHRFCDHVLLVRAPAFYRIIRALKRDRLTLIAIFRRIWAQRFLNMPPENVDMYTVWNCGNRQRIEHRVLMLVEQLYNQG